MRAEKEETAESEEQSGEKAKKIVVIRPAEIIALALAVVFIVAAGYFTVRSYVSGELVFVPESSTVRQIETEFVVNINTADKNELMMLDGIGEALAERIIEYRKEHGDFDTVWEITNVRGISQKTLERLYPHITV